MEAILGHWPLWFVCGAMIVAAVIDGWKLKVPNWLTFPLVFSGWALGLAHNFNWLPDSTGIGGIGASFAATMLGFALLFPVYAIGGMGAGDVKMQMGFGAWIGAFYGFGTELSQTQSGALGILTSAFCLAVVIGGFLAVGMIIVRGQYRRNLTNTRQILGDLFQASSVGEVADKAAKRKPRMHLLPYGIPLCLGFISYLTFWPRLF
jgi:prepilin peptidase CpaA